MDGTYAHHGHHHTEQQGTYYPHDHDLGARGSVVYDYGHGQDSTTPGIPHEAYHTDADDHDVQQIPLNSGHRTDTGIFSTTGTYEGTQGYYQHSSDDPAHIREKGHTSTEEYYATAPGQDPIPDGHYHDPVPTRKFKPYAPFFIGLVISAALLGGVIALVRKCEKMGVMDSIDKYTFNTLIIFLSLALGTNLASAYQHFAQLVKYGILAMPTDFDWSFRQDPHFRQIIGLRTVIRYMFRGLPAIGKKRYSLLFTSLWLFFNLATAVGISLIGLTYSLETLGAQTVGEKPGYTSVVDLAHFYPSNVFNDTLIDQVERFSAKLFGDVSTGFKVIKPGQPSEHDEFNVIELGDGKWQYAFKNMDRPGGVMRKSDRTITTHASCKANKITSLDFQNSAFTTVDADNNTKTHDILFSGKATTYFSRSVDISEEGDENYKLDTLGCEDENPRCATVEVVQVVSYTDPMQEGNWYFKCESVVEEVVGAKKDQHKLVDRQAKIAAAAISHSGVFWSVYEDGSDEPVAEQVAEMGYYMQGVVWGEVVNGDTARMASMIARFSAGCIAATDQLNPRVNVYGMRPWAGVALSVKWWRLHAVILALIGVQLVGGMFCLIWWMLATKGKKSVMEPVGV